jgi:sortase A
MRRLARPLGTALIVAGVLGLAWVVMVWQWQDPVTGLYTHWKQHQLAQSIDRQFAAYSPTYHVGRLDRNDLAAERHAIATDAARFRRDAKRGQAIGRIVVGRIGLRMVIVNGTDHESLKKGPGRDLRSFMPGQDRLVYIAGHRTTYLAPFSHIDAIQRRDVIRIEMPYATFVYRATGHRIVAATDLSVLRSPKHELLELQACHPRFFATHRYIVYARLATVLPRGGAPYSVEAAGRD